MFDRSLAALLENDRNAKSIHGLLVNIDMGGIGLETAIRGAGFVVGFETCRQLMIGDLDLPAIKDGAR